VDQQGQHEQEHGQRDQHATRIKKQPYTPHRCSPLC